MDRSSTVHRWRFRDLNIVIIDFSVWHLKCIVHDNLPLPVLDHIAFIVNALFIYLHICFAERLFPFFVNLKMSNAAFSCEIQPYVHCVCAGNTEGGSRKTVIVSKDRRSKTDVSKLKESCY